VQQPHPICCSHQLMCDRWVIHAVPCTGHQPQLHLWPSLAQLHCCRGRTDKVPLPLHCYTRDVPHTINVIQQRLLLQKCCVNAVVRFQQRLCLALVPVPSVL